MPKYTQGSTDVQASGKHVKTALSIIMVFLNQTFKTLNQGEANLPIEMLCPFLQSSISSTFEGVEGEWYIRKNYLVVYFYWHNMVLKYRIPESSSIHSP
jgi:hypothetical protein